MISIDKHTSLLSYIIQNGCKKFYVWSLWWVFQNFFPTWTKVDKLHRTNAFRTTSINSKLTPLINKIFFRCVPERPSLFLIYCGRQGPKGRDWDEDLVMHLRETGQFDRFKTFSLQRFHVNSSKDIWPTDIGPSDIWPTDIWPSDIWPSDIWLTEMLMTDI